jgi:alanine racemase
VYTHFATADEPAEDEGYFEAQLARFDEVARAVKAQFPDVARRVIPAVSASALWVDFDGH